MEASDCFLYFLPEELREFEVFFTSPVSGGAAVGDGGNLFFGSSLAKFVCLFRGSRLLAIEVIKVSVPLLRS